MTRRMFALIIVLTVSLLLPPWSKAENSGDQEKAMNFTIWSDNNGKFAAGELRWYLSQITGRDWQLVASPDQAAIRLRLQHEAFGRDAFTLHSAGTKLEITGANPRSLYYGVYALLEQTAGCRFYEPADEYRPKLPNWTIPPQLDVHETAAFRSRQLRLEWNQNAPMTVWAAKNRFNLITMDFWNWDQPSGAGIREVAKSRGLELGGSGHGMFYFLPTKKYFAAHPEWFPEIDGKRTPTKNTGDNFCYSNADARAELVRNMIEFCRKHPYLTTINLWPGDGGLICRCPQCRTKSLMECYGVLMEEAQSAMKKACPNVRLSLLAYNYDLKDKTSASLRPPDTAPHVPAMFAFWGQNLTIPLQNNPEPGHRLALNSMTDYARRHPGQAEIFAYYTDTYMNSDLCPVFNASMPVDLRFYKSLGVDEICLLWIPWDSLNSSRTEWIACQNAALLGHLTMNLQCRTDALCRPDTQALQDQLNTILGKLSTLIFPFAPPRSIDAWGCGFSREIMKWEPVPERRQLEEQRLKLFRQADAELAALVSRLPSTDNPNVKQICEHIRHCAVRVTGLRYIFEAQMAIRDKQWTAAASWLERALAGNMPEEKEQTAAWLQQVKIQAATAKTAK